MIRDFKQQQPIKNLFEELKHCYVFGFLSFLKSTRSKESNYFIFILNLVLIQLIRHRNIIVCTHGWLLHSKDGKNSIVPTQQISEIHHKWWIKRSIDMKIEQIESILVQKFLLFQSFLLHLHFVGDSTPFPFISS